MREVIRHKPNLTPRELEAGLLTEFSVQSLRMTLKRFRLTVALSAHRR
jgi:hypothetical protein